MAKKDLKIALYNLTTTTKAGGIETFNWGMANYLAMKGYTIHIYGGRGDIREEVNERVSIFTYPFLPRTKVPDLGSRFRKFIERLSFGLFTIRDLIKRDYDLIYIHKPFDLPIVLLSSRFSSAKVVFGSGGTEFFPGYSFLIRRLDYFFCCSNYNADMIERYCGVRPIVLYNGINTMLFKPTNPDIELKKRLGIKDGEKVFITACRLVGLKGVQYGIKAIMGLSKRHKIKYLIIGKGEFEKRLRDMVYDYKLQDVITFLGALPNKELYRYYSIAHIAIFPSIDEAFSISIGEAMACGIPVISTNVGGTPEIVKDRETGLLVPPKDEKALASAIDIFLSDEDLRKRIGVKARHWIAEQFSWERIVERFERCIDYA